MSINSLKYHASRPPISDQSELENPLGALQTRSLDLGSNQSPATSSPKHNKCRPPPLLMSSCSYLFRTATCARRLPHIPSFAAKAFSANLMTSSSEEEAFRATMRGGIRPAKGQSASKENRKSGELPVASPSAR